MLHLFGGDTVARRQAPAWRFPWKLVLTALALTLIATFVAGVILVVANRFSSSAPAQQPVQTENVPAVVPVVPAVKEWPRITPEWKYTLTIPPVPLVDDEIYNGRSSDTTWDNSIGQSWYGLVPSADVTRREIAKRIVPSITDKDAVGLSIRRNPDNPRVVLAAVHIIRDVATTSGMRQETHLALSVDNQKSWTELALPFNGAKNSIDRVVVTGTSPLFLEIDTFSDPGYWKTTV